MAIIKSKEDIETLKHSSRILMSCMYRLGELVKPGVKASELDTFATEFIRDHNAEPSFLGYQGFKYAVCVSINDEVVHGIAPEHKIIPENSLVSLDLGVNYKGLFSDSAYTFVAGEVSQREMELIEITKKVLKKGVSVVKAGARVGDIGYACQTEAEKHHVGNVMELGGHGLGYAVHEEPFIQHAGKKGKGARLFENQVIAIEPMITLGTGEVEFDETLEDGWTVRTADRTQSAHFEHTILVTKRGAELLTEIKPEDLL